MAALQAMPRTKSCEVMFIFIFHSRSFLWNLPGVNEKKTLHHKKKNMYIDSIDLFFMVFFHDDVTVGGFPPNIRKLQLPFKLRIKPSMCEREEWPNHLQGNGVGTVHETPILGGD